jgi:Carboxypeptidase regulatory-like domain
MRLYALLGVVGFFALAASTATAATITGTVIGPDGQPFRAAFVQARHDGLHRTVSVLSDNQGHYSIEGLPAGDYRIQIRAIGNKVDAKRGVKLTDDQSATLDFALQTAPIRWSDISIYQGWVLLPEARGKKTLFENCMSCHGFQARMAAVVRDEDGWRDRVTYMREAMRSSLADRQGFSDQQAEDVIYYLNRMFGEQSDLPKSPTRCIRLRGHGAEVQRRSAQDCLRRL